MMPERMTKPEEPETAPVRRLVIRVTLPSHDSLPPPPPIRQPLNKRALLLILAVVALPLCWLGIKNFSSHSAPLNPAPSSASSVHAIAPRETAPVLSAKPNPVVEAAKPAEPQNISPPDAPPSSVHEVLPQVSSSALQTIRGTVRVSVRVIVDKQGSVIAASADDPGPSRYFERRSVEASKNWKFTPASSEERRVMLVKFNFTRFGATAHADAVH